MRLKLYRASGVTEAMARVRAELGLDALILATRKVPGGVELTAALEPEDDLPVALPDPERQRMLRWHGVPDRLAEKIATGALETALERTMRFGALDLSSESPQPLLLAGPPGAGKTLTVARLATRLVMAGAQPLIITTDGRRAGATEQLAAFTRLLGLTLIVASHPATLARALLRRVPGAPVLIDAPGTDPFDPSQNDEVAGLAVTANATTALVLPAGMDPAESADLAAAFATAGADPPRWNQARSGTAGGRAAGRRGCREVDDDGGWDRSGCCGRVGAADAVSTGGSSLPKQRVPFQSVVRGVADMSASIASSTLRRPRLLAIASGKGGVGKTWLSVTLSRALVQAGRTVLLFDGDLGLANVDIQLGIMPEHDLTAVIAGRRTVAQSAAIYPAGGFAVLAGRSGSGALSALDPLMLDRVLEALAAETSVSDIVLDLGAGLDRSVRRMAAVADTLLVVATEEPTSLTDAYAVLKLASADRPGGGCAPGGEPGQQQGGGGAYLRHARAG